MQLFGLIVPLLVAALVFGVAALLWHALGAAREELRSLGRIDAHRPER